MTTSPNGLPISLLVDDSRSFLAAGSPEGELWSCSSGLRYALPGSPMVRSPEALVTSETVDRLGRTMRFTKDHIGATLRAIETSNPDFANVNATHKPQIYNLYFSMATKAMILNAWLDAVGETEAVVVGSPRPTPAEDLSAEWGIYDHLFAALAHAMAEDPVNRHSPCPRLIETPGLEPRLFFESFHHVPAFDRVFNILNRTPSAVAYRAWRKLGAPALGRGRQGTILLLSDNEGIEEAFAAFLRDGWRVVPVSPDLGQAEPAKLPDGLEPRLSADWFESVSALLPPALARAGWRVLWQRLAPVLARHPDRLRQLRHCAKSWKKEHGTHGKRLVTLGDGLYAPIQRLLDACLRESGIPVICSDHGTSIGLVAWHEAAADISISFSDVYLAYSKLARDRYVQARTLPNQRVEVIGTPNILNRTNLPALQRHAARRYLGLGRREPTLMYVSSLAFNNHQPGYRSTTDDAYTSFQAQLVDTLRAFPGRVVVKPYPAHRYPDRDPLWVMDLPENTVLAPFGEFRHVRWAADIILLDLSSSTISWAAGTDLPLILVDSCQNPYTQQAADALRKVMFFVNGREEGWTADLARLISRPLTDIQAEWDEGSADRARVVGEYILGERGGFPGGLTRALAGWSEPGPATAARSAA